MVGMCLMAAMDGSAVFGILGSVVPVLVPVSASGVPSGATVVALLSLSCLGVITVWFVIYLPLLLPALGSWRGLVSGAAR